MLRALLGCGGIEEPLLAAPRAGERVRDIGRAVGERAGLVEQHRRHALRIFERRAVAEKDAALRGALRAGHDRRGRRKAERTGTGDHEHAAHAVHRPVAVAGSKNKIPEARRQQRQCRHDGNENTRRAVGQPRRRGFAVLRLAHDADDLLQHAVAPERGRGDADAPAAAERAAVHRVARRLLHADALAGEHGFVRRACALEHRAVHGDALARAHEHDIVFRDVFQINFLFPAAALHARPLRLQTQQTADGLRGLAAGELLEVAPEQDEALQHALAEEVKADVDRHRERRHGTVEVQYRDRERHESIHARRAASKTVPRAAVEDAAREEDEERGEHELRVRVDVPHKRQRQQDRERERAQQPQPLGDLALLLAAAPRRHLRAHAHKAQRSQQRAALYVDRIEPHREDVPLARNGANAENAAKRFFGVRGGLFGQGSARKLRFLRGNGEAFAAYAFFDGIERRERLVVFDAAHPGGVGRGHGRNARELFHGAVESRRARGAVEPRHAKRDLSHGSRRVPSSRGRTRGRRGTSRAGTAPAHGKGRSS